jgi:hypothetical protein
MLLINTISNKNKYEVITSNKNLLCSLDYLEKKNPIHIFRNTNPWSTEDSGLWKNLLLELYALDNSIEALRHMRGKVKIRNGKCDVIFTLSTLQKKTV